jgi:uncharacterized oligopeptide transporter (OPT) family protein
MDRLSNHVSFGNRVYEIPGKLFQVPTAYVWIFTARLVTGQGLPYMAKEWATGAGALFVVTTLARTLSVGKRWRSLIPGGIAVAVGEYFLFNSHMVGEKTSSNSHIQACTTCPHLLWLEPLEEFSAGTG